MAHHQAVRFPVHTFFCDKSLFCLCVYFAFGVYFLSGGLERDDMNPDIQYYVFPYLFQMRKASVAQKLT